VLPRCTDAATLDASSHWVRGHITTIGSESKRVLGVFTNHDEGALRPALSSEKLDPVVKTESSGKPVVS
jgi:hypothetical protein